MESEENNRPQKHVLARIAICTVILVFGAVGMKGLASLKKPPAEAKKKERSIKVKTITVHPRDYPVRITGYGQANALTIVALSPEISGKVVHIHPALKTGRIIPAGEILFRIDPADYEAALQEARAGVSQWQNTVARLKKQLAIDTQRLKTVKRSAQLAKIEFERVKRLFEVDRVGTRSGVDQAERSYNASLDQADQMAQAVSLYPLQIKEAESSLMSARARRAIAVTNLSRCTVKTPFDARIKTVALEVGQFISPGQHVLTLADDRVLEIHVPLDSRDARQWLQFQRPAANRPATAWFSGLQEVACTIRWTEDKTGSTWTGTVNRVVTFDQQTRTLTVAVKVPAEAALGNGDRSLPLVEGMFCQVQIPGKTMPQVYRLPRQAVSYENNAYLATADGRLKTVEVSVDRIENDYAYVSQGLRPGDRVIVTRLIDPLENTLLEMIDTPDAKETES